jgi:hypothetical protein
MHVGGDKGYHDATLQVGQVSSDKNCQIFNLKYLSVPPFLEGEGVLIGHVSNVSLSGLTPHDLSDGSNTLSRMLRVHNPVFTILSSVVRNSSLHLFSESSDDHAL